MALGLETLKGLRLSRVPHTQIAVAHTFLRLSYALPRRTVIVLEGLENVPKDRTVFYAMNHTDRYNYWPFQYAMWKKRMRYTATWVKGKYFESAFMAKWMIATNNIPLPSRGYVIATGFREAMKRVPAPPEYRALRDLADGLRAAPGPDASPDVLRFLEAGGLARFEALFSRMVDEVVRLNRQALRELDLNVLVFPQGTRSIRLSKGHIGLAQMSQHFGTSIVPVGCSGCDKIYPGGSPWAKGGTVVYRIGKPLAVDGPELAPFRVMAPFAPLTLAAGREHGEQFREITDVVMSRINDLVDEPYRFDEKRQSGGVQEMERFL